MAGKSRAGFIMQGARGKLGDVVFKKAEGRTIQVQRVQPKNPKTAKQMAQRIIFATVNQAASWLSKLVDHSFEGVATGTKSIREFVRLNLNLMRQYAADDFANQPTAENAKCFVTTKGINTLIPNRYLVSKGTIQYDGVLVRDTRFSDYALKSRGFILNGTTHRAGGNTITVDVKSFDILSLLGIHSINDQLSFVFTGVNQSNTLFTYGDDNNILGYVINEGKHSVRRIVPLSSLNENSTVKLLFEDYENIDVDRTINSLKGLFDLTKTDDDFLSYVLSTIISTSFTVDGDLDDDGTDVSLTFQEYNYEGWDTNNTQYMGSNFHTKMGGLIRSSYENGKWLRSTCILEGSGPSVYINYGLCWAVANDAWNQGTTIASGAEFLDQGNSGGSLT